MKRSAFKRPGRVLAFWSLACVGLAALLIGYDVALAHYGGHLRDTDYRTYLGLAWEEVQVADFVGAMAHAERAMELAPERPEPYAMAGSIHYRLKHWERARENMAKAIERGDRSRGPRMDLVWSAIELGRYDEAAELGARFASEVEDNAVLLQYAAEAHLRAERPAEAIPFLRRALAASPDNLYQLSRLASAYRDTGDAAAAAEIQARIDAIHDAIGQLGTIRQ